MADYNLASDAFYQNPYPTYAAMREHDPIWHDEQGNLTFITRHDDVNALLRHRTLGRQITHLVDRESLGWDPIDPAHEPFHRINRHSLMDMEPPDHTRIKSLVMKVFTPRRVERMREATTQLARQIIDRVTDAGQMDLLEDFAVPLSVTVIADLLGVPEADRAQLRPWSADIVAMYEISNQGDDTIVDRAVAASQAFSEYLQALAADRRDNPQPDLISDLVQVQEAGDQLSEAELISTCILILNAGHEATVNVVGNGMISLLRHPDQWAQLKRDRGLTASAIEEMMRYDTPLPLFRRWVLDDLTYGGRDFTQGDEVALLLAAANHDPAVFDDPDRFDITREYNPHVSFGAGIHYCLGAPLARMELQVAIDTLRDRLPKIYLTDAPITYHRTATFRGVESLPVTW